MICSSLQQQLCTKTNFQVRAHPKNKKKENKGNPTKEQQQQQH
jgi:hypothetical protein